MELDAEKIKKQYKVKAKKFPVKFCPVCRRCYQGADYLNDFPSISCEKIICYSCRNKTN